MAAVSFDDNLRTHIKNDTLSSTPNNVREITLDGRPAVLTLRGRTNDIKVSTVQSLNDDDALAANDYFTLTAKTPRTIDVSGMAKVIIASATASAVVELIRERL